MTPDEKLARFEQMMALTDEERARLEAAPFSATPGDWRYFATGIAENALDGYRRGELDLDRLVRTVHDCAVGCDTRSRVSLIGMTVARAIRIKPNYRGARRPRYPIWLRSAAGDLVVHLRNLSPDAPLRGDAPPGARAQPVLSVALLWITCLNLFPGRRAPAETSLYAWYIERCKAKGLPVARGRPRKR